MTDLTKHKSSEGRWAVGYPFLWVPRETSGSPIRERYSWLSTLRCRLRRNAVDKKLAAGADPDSSECRHLRAAQLTAKSNRQALAAAYERHLLAASRVPQLDVVPVNWSGVRAAAPRLERLARRLRDDPHVRVQGVARARLLLTDRDSPMYAEGDGMSLADEVRSTQALL